jgi:hypothetical protein
MNYAKYEMQRPFPKAPKSPVLPNNPTPDDYRKHATLLEAQVKALEDYRLEASDWKAEEARLLSAFKADALAEVGLTGHPKADKAYDLAWENGHSGGLQDVYNHLLDYADLLKD